jgi:hypothetical protein
MSIKILINFFSKPSRSQSYRFHSGLGDNVSDARQVASILQANNRRAANKVAFISVIVVRYLRGDPSQWIWDWAREALGSDILVRVPYRYYI